jgi:hypothetical protein
MLTTLPVYNPPWEKQVENTWGPNQIFNVTQSKLHFKLERTRNHFKCKIHPVPNCDKYLFWKSGLSVFSDSAYSPRKSLFLIFFNEVGIRESRAILIFVLGKTETWSFVWAASWVTLARVRIEHLSWPCWLSVHRWQASLLCLHLHSTGTSALWSDLAVEIIS